MGDFSLDQQIPDRILALNRIKMWVDASLHQAINSLDEDRGHAPDVAAELALLLSVSEQHARRVVDLSTTLVHRLPETLAAMESGVCRFLSGFEGGQRYRVARRLAGSGG
ncbi:hypothetical protein ABZ863_19420 [Saccharomonospora sp. NPDC046836]|uniref:hypothetical protein n=1 Tax=Saccharomonospora sp. NPDC046836 TaxID=3156921 RepID=UPI0033CE4B07